MTIADILKQHGISERYSLDDIEVAPHPQFAGVPMLWFRSEGNPLIALDLGGASQVREKARAIGETAFAARIDALIAKAQGTSALQQQVFNGPPIGEAR